MPVAVLVDHCVVTGEQLVHRGQAAGEVAEVEGQRTDSLSQAIHQRLQRAQRSTVWRADGDERAGDLGTAFALEERASDQAAHRVGGDQQLRGPEPGLAAPALQDGHDVAPQPARVGATRQSPVVGVGHQVRQAVGVALVAFDEVEAFAAQEVDKRVVAVDR